MGDWQLPSPPPIQGPGFIFAQSGAGEGEGNVTYGEAFTVQPFGNSLVTMTLTAQDIKDVLEEQFAGCRGQSPAATYRVTVHNFMADGGDGYATFKNKGTNRLGGAQDIDALRPTCRKISARRALTVWAAWPVRTAPTSIRSLFMRGFTLDHAVCVKRGVRRSP